MRTDCRRVSTVRTVEMEKSKGTSVKSTCFSIVPVLLLSASEVAQSDDRLVGKWQPIMLQQGGEVAISEADKGIKGFRFTDDEKVLWLSGDHVGIPLHGSSFDCHFDVSRKPHRLEMSFREAGKHVFAYCLYQVQGDMLVMKMLFPLILSQNYVSDVARREFLDDSYPGSFATKKGDASVLIVLRRVDRKKRPQPEDKRRPLERHLPLPDLPENIYRDE